MDYIPSIYYEDDYLYIPYIDGKSYCKFVIKEGEEWSDLFKRHSTYESGKLHVYQTFHIFDKDSDVEMEIYVYEIKDEEETTYFVITFGEWLYTDYENLSAVCLPHNRFSLIKFYNDFLIPLSINGYCTT